MSANGGRRCYFVYFVKVILEVILSSGIGHDKAVVGGPLIDADHYGVPDYYYQYSGILILQASAATTPPSSSAATPKGDAMYDQETIKTVLPHRDPFLFCDRILECSPERTVAEVDYGPDRYFRRRGNFTRQLPQR